MMDSGMAMQPMSQPQQQVQAPLGQQPMYNPEQRIPDRRAPAPEPHNTPADTRGYGSVGGRKGNSIE